MSKDHRQSDRTSSDGPGVTHDHAGHAVAGVTCSHGTVKFEARRR